MVGHQAVIIAVVGAKGGVGSTVVAQNLAVLLSKRENVLIVDFDQDCQGDMSRNFGFLDGARTFSEIINNLNNTPRLIRGYLDAGISNLGLIQARPCNSPEGQFDPNSLGQVLNFLSNVYSYIIIDGGAKIESIASAFSLIHKIVIVSKVDPSALECAKRMLRELSHLGVSKDNIDVIINGWGSGIGLSESAVREKLGIEGGYFLPGVNSEIIESNIEGIPLSLKNPSNLFVEALDRFSRGLLDIDFGNTLLCGNEDIDLPHSEGDQASGVDSQFKERVLKRLSSSKEIKKLIEDRQVHKTDRSLLERKISEAVHNILDQDPDYLIKDTAAFTKEVIDEAIGLGPIERFVADPEITEIMVNDKDEIYIERRGRIEKAEACFANEKSVLSIIERIVAPMGRRIDESSPIVDARLSDGSRVHVIIPPLSLKGPTITIRKFREEGFTVEDLIAHGSINRDAADFLKECVETRVNILVSGGTGSGKTTMLNVLSSFIPSEERIITIEDAAELKLRQPHVVRLESRPPNIEGKGEVTIRDLVRASLRMRPDRIIVGEVRGAEALDMLQAMNTGHDGSLTTVHANSTRDSLARLETLVLFAGFDLPVKAIRDQIVSAIDVVIQLKRMRDGSRKVVHISEITGIEGQTVTMQELFVFDDGEFISTGFRPKCLP